MFREMYILVSARSVKCTFRIMYIVLAKCFSGKCNFWKAFFGEMYRIQFYYLKTMGKHRAVEGARPLMLFSVSSNDESDHHQSIKLFVLPSINKSAIRFFFSFSDEHFDTPLHFCTSSSRDVIWENMQCPGNLTDNFTLYGGTESSKAITIYNSLYHHENRTLIGILNTEATKQYMDPHSFLFYVPGKYSTSTQESRILQNCMVTLSMFAT